MRFPKELPNDSPYLPREVVGDKNARRRARDLLGMAQPEFSAAFKGSPIMRATPRGLKRNAAVVLGNLGTGEDVPSLVAALAHPEPLVRTHVAWALGRVERHASVPLVLRARRAPPRGVGS